MDKQTEGHVTLRDHANQDNETISNKHALLTTQVFWSILPGSANHYGPWNVGL